MREEGKNKESVYEGRRDRSEEEIGKEGREKRKGREEG